MSSHAGRIIKSNRPEGPRKVTDLSTVQKALLDASGMSPESKEYKQIETKMKLSNLDGALSFAREVADAVKKIDNNSTQGIGR